MKAETIITTVREDYTEDTNSSAYLFSDASLLRKLTEAERQACMRGNYLFDDTTPDYTRITLIDGTQSYLLDPKVTVVEKVIFAGVPLVKKTKEELDRDYSTWRTDTKLTGNTVYYAISGRRIYFSRIPNSDDDGLTVYLEVYRLPDEDIKSLSQEPELPEEHHRGLLNWILYECYNKPDIDIFDKDRALMYLELFTEEFGPVVSAKVRQHQFESPRSLTLRPSTANTVEYDEDW